MHVCGEAEPACRPELTIKAFFACSGPCPPCACVLLPVVGRYMGGEAVPFNQDMLDLNHGQAGGGAGGGSAGHGPGSASASAAHMFQVSHCTLQWAPCCCMSYPPFVEARESCCDHPSPVVSTLPNVNPCMSRTLSPSPSPGRCPCACVDRASCTNQDRVEVRGLPRVVQGAAPSVHGSRSCLGPTHPPPQTTC